MSVRADAPQTPHTFLPFLHGKETFGNAFTAFKPLSHPENFTATPFAVSALSDAADAIASHSDEGDTYVTIGVFDGNRRERSDVTHNRFLWLDRDEKPRSRRLPDPTLTLETSPGRFQDIWRMCAPLPPEDAETLARRIAVECGCGFQAVASNQVLRVPGTINYGVGKGRDPALVRTVEYRPYSLYAPLSFDRIAPLPLPAPSIALPSLSGTADGMQVLARTLPYLTARMRACAEGEPVLKADGTAYGVGTNGESERDQALLVALLRQGLSDDEAAAAFLSTPRGAMLVSRKGIRDLPKRMARAIANGRKYLAANPFVPTTPYIRIDAAILAQSAELRPRGLAVAVVLASHAPHIFPPQKRIAKLLQISQKNVREQLDLLDVLHLAWVSKHYQRQHVYSLVTTPSPAARIPRSVMSSLLRLGVDAIAVYAVMAGQETSPACLHATQKGLADALAIPRQRVNITVVQLEKLGMIEVAEMLRNGVKAYGISHRS